MHDRSTDQKKSVDFVHAVHARGLLAWLATKVYHTAYVVTTDTSFAFTIYGMKCGLTWDYRNPLLGQSSLEEC